MVRKGLLIFPIFTDLSWRDPILRKNTGIRKAFEHHGIKADVLASSSKGILCENESIFHFSPWRPQRIYQQFFASWREITKAVLRNRYDFVWLRMPMVTSSLVAFAKRIREEGSGCRLILEYGTFPYREELSPARKVFYDLNRWNQDRLHKNADFMITYCGQDSVDGVPVIPMGNGIDLDDVSLVSPNGVSASTLSFIGVATLKKAHGYERFISGMPAYMKKPDAKKIHFHIVGEGPERAQLEALTTKLALRDAVTFHGFKGGKDLDAIYNSSQVAISALAFHRIGIEFCSSLKNREYLAKGLPVVLSTPDKDLPPGLPYVKYVPTTEDPIDISEIVRFTEDVYKRPGVHAEIRKASEDHISWNSKIATVLAHLNKA